MADSIPQEDFKQTSLGRALERSFKNKNTSFFIGSASIPDGEADKYFKALVVYFEGKKGLNITEQLTGPRIYAANFEETFGYLLKYKLSKYQDDDLIELAKTFKEAEFDSNLVLRLLESSLEVRPDVVKIFIEQFSQDYQSAFQRRIITSLANKLHQEKLEDGQNFANIILNIEVWDGTDVPDWIDVQEIKKAASSFAALKYLEKEKSAHYPLPHRDQALGILRESSYLDRGCFGHVGELASTIEELQAIRDRNPNMDSIENLFKEFAAHKVTAQQRLCDQEAAALQEDGLSALPEQAEIVTEESYIEIDSSDRKEFLAQYVKLAFNSSDADHYLNGLEELGEQPLMQALANNNEFSFSYNDQTTTIKHPDISTIAAAFDIPALTPIRLYTKDDVAPSVTKAAKDFAEKNNLEFESAAEPTRQITISGVVPDTTALVLRKLQTPAYDMEASDNNRATIDGGLRPT